MKKNNKTVLIAAAGGLIVVLYNVVLFVLAGFAGHGAAFWSSYALTMVGFVAAALSLYFFTKSNKEHIDVFLTFPVIRRTVVYLIAQLVISTLFIVLDCCKVSVPWAIAFILQIIMLVVYIVLVVTCFLSKEVITDNEAKIKQKTFTFKMLNADAQTLVELCNDAEAKKVFEKFAEEIRYSDPVSSEYLVPLENEIQSCIMNAKIALSEGNNEEALKICNRATLLLRERNMKCKALK